eukprot:1223608-Amphidinium_carterae.1
MSPSKSGKFWKSNSMLELTGIMCPTWQDLVVKHSLIHYLSHPPTEGADPETGKVRVWIHSCVSSLDRMITAGDVGARYTFVSAIQCAMHRIAHSHFNLSSAVLKPDTCLLEIEVSELWLIESGQRAINGFTESVSVPKLPIIDADIKLAGVIHLSTGLEPWLNGPEGMKLTRASISQFEAFSEAGSMDRYRLLNQETVQALFMEMPGSRKVRATLEAQCPEVYESWMQVVSAVKAEWDSEKKAAATATTTATAANGSTSSSTTIQLSLAPGDELNLSLKRAKLE